MLKKILKRYLPKYILKFIRVLRGMLRHHGLIFLLLPPLKKIFRYLPDSTLRFLMAKKVLTSDFVVNYAIPRKKRLKIMKTYNKDIFYLNIGGGLFNSKKNWRLLEYSGDPILRIGYRYHPELIDYNIDLMKLERWSISSNKADLVYTSHCLEHISEEAAEVAFKEIFRIMKMGAVFRITLPDVDLAYKALLKDDLDFFSVENDPCSISNDPCSISTATQGKVNSIEDKFLRFFTPFKLNDLNIEEFRNDVKCLDKVSLLDKYSTTKGHDYHHHINWFNFNKIKKFGLMVGFGKENIILSAPNQSVNPEMRTEEFDKTFPHISLYVDMIK